MIFHDGIKFIEKEYGACNISIDRDYSAAYNGRENAVMEFVNDFSVTVTMKEIGFQKMLRDLLLLQNLRNSTEINETTIEGASFKEDGCSFEDAMNFNIGEQL